MADRPLRILMVAPTSFFADYGGHIRILEETLILKGLGHQVTIVTYYKGNDLPGIDIRRTAPLPWHAEYEVGSSRHKLAFDVYLGATTWKVARQLRPDVIHGHMHEGALIGGAVARMLRVPLVFDFQGSLTGEMLDHRFIRPGGLRHRFFHRLETIISRQVPQAILTSSVRACELLTNEFKVPPEIIRPLPDCVDTARFDPERCDGATKARLRAQLGIPAERPIVAYLGLLADYQGIPDLIQAAARLKADGVDAHFLIMGYPNVESYRALAWQHGVADRVTLPGRIPYEKAPEYLSLGDIAVSAKLSLTEGSGKVLNYMAMGQPVVAYDTRVHREYLAEWGIYARPGDANHLAELIGDLLADPARQLACGSGLRRRAEGQYSWAAAGRAIETVYRELM